MLKQFINYISFASIIGFIISCSSTKDFSEYENISGILIETGVASWYGPKFNGKKAASGEIYDMNELTAAHRTLPFNSIVRIINSSNGKSVIVRINDRGPYVKDRIIDLSKEAATKIGMIENGSAVVKLFLLSETKLPINLKIPHYTVQVGSYKTRTEAFGFSTAINDAKVVEANVNGERYYRIYVGLFADINDANNLKNSLQSKGINGFVKQVEN